MLRSAAPLLLLNAGLSAQPAPYDIVIAGACVVDGSGSPWFFADIGIRGDTITAVDRAEYDKPRQYSVGVHHVIVNGKVVLRQDQVTSERPGHALLGPSAKR